MIKRLIPLVILIAFNIYSYAQQFQENTSISLPASQHYEFVDINNDGFLDLIPFSGDGKIYYFDGSDYDPVSILGLGICRISDFVDENCDGYIDCFYISEFDMSTVFKFLTNNSGTYYCENWLFGEEYSLYSFDYNDFDNNGLVDLFFHSGGYGGGNIYSQRTGIDCFEISEEINYNNNLNNFELATDFNNDGFLDVITSKGLYDYTDIDYYIPVWEHDLTATNWGDYDSDGKMDLLAVYNDSIIVVNNNDISDFDYFYVGGLPDKTYISVQWGDYDNDGDLDILAEDYLDFPNSSTVMIFENKSSDLFEVSENLYLNDYSVPQFSDYDSDGDLDVFAVSTDDLVIFENTIEIPNYAPDAPTNLSTQIHNDTVILSWDKPLDDHTNSLSLTYNIKLGITSGGIELTSPNSLANGTRLIEKKGNQLLDTFAIFILPAGTYYWSIQAIDNCFKGSEFSEEVSFTIVINNISDQTELPDFTFEQDLSSESITLALDENKNCSGCNITITDINGRLKTAIPVKSESVNINTTGWAKGIYFCTLTDNKNSTKAKKFVLF